MDNVYMFVGVVVVWSAFLLVALYLGFILAFLIRHVYCAFMLTRHLIRRETVKDSYKLKKLWRCQLLFMCMFKLGVYDAKSTYCPRKDARDQRLLILDFQKFIPRKIQ